MSYGFTCGYCLDTLETPHQGCEEAERFADKAGWWVTFGSSSHFEGNAHNTCPSCAESASLRVHIG